MAVNIIETNLSFKSMSNRSHTTRIILHHAAAKSCTAEQIHQWHLNNGWSGAGYHFLVRKDGNIYRLRPENKVGAHASGSNSDSLGVCFEGDFMSETMGDTQKNAGAELVSYLKSKYGISTVKRHKDVCATDCPGTNFPFNEIANNGTSTSATTSGGYNDLAIDGKAGVKTIKRWQEVMGCKVCDGIISNQFIAYKPILRGIMNNAIEYVNNPRPHYSPFIKAVQERIGATPDGWVGPKFVRKLQQYMGTGVDGELWNPSDCIKAVQQRLNDGWF